MDKQTLRKTFLEKRSKLSQEEFQRRTDLILTAVKDLVHLLQPGPVHIFLPISKFREVDTWPIIQWLWHLSIATMTTITDTGSNSLLHVWLDKKTKLRESKWGIPEPVNAQTADPAHCSAVFVPLIVFDAQLNRIGYGKGYYDKFLSGLPPKIKRIGLSLSPPLDRIPYVEPHDQPLDVVIWPGGIASR